SLALERHRQQRPPSRIRRQVDQLLETALPRRPDHPLIAHPMLADVPHAPPSSARYGGAASTRASHVAAPVCARPTTPRPRPPPLASPAPPAPRVPPPPSARPGRARAPRPARAAPPVGPPPTGAGPRAPRAGARGRPRGTQTRSWPFACPPRRGGHGDPSHTT